MTRGGNTYFYTMDGLGSVRNLTNSTQDIVEQYDYDSFGNLTAPPTTGNPYTYTSREYDPETGLLFYRARYYDPATGRFLTADPIGFDSGDVNFYAYVLNNPDNSIDPFGLYGTNDCSYYAERCLEVGGKYYCEQAKYWCNKFFPKPDDPDPNRDDDFEGWYRCTRQCLQDCDAKDAEGEPEMCPVEPDDRKGPWDPRSKSFDCHKKCYIDCRFKSPKGNPFK
jgi:RHS repeat-associated protein